jgi:hypothetical protein
MASWQYVTLKNAIAQRSKTCDTQKSLDRLIALMEIVERLEDGTLVASDVDYLVDIIAD